MRHPMCAGAKRKPPVGTHARQRRYLSYHRSSMLTLKSDPIFLGGSSLARVMSVYPVTRQAAWSNPVFSSRPCSVLPASKRSPTTSNHRVQNPKMKECAVLLIHGRRASYFPSPYADAYGERQRHSFRGRPLFLDPRRYEVVRGLWVKHLVAHEVGKPQRDVCMGK